MSWYVLFWVAGRVSPYVQANIPNQQELWAQAGSAASQYLAEKVDQLRVQGLPHVSSVLIEGSAEGPAAAISDLARKTSDNLVIMSTLMVDQVLDAGYWVASPSEWSVTQTIRC
jgi:hypothetical protein